MKKEEAIKEKEILLEKLKAVQEIIDKPEITPKQRLLELINGCEIKIDLGEYPDSIFFFKNGEYYFEIEKQYLWCGYKYVWQIFENEFSMNYSQIQALIKDVVEEHFKCNGLTPILCFRYFIYSVEEHFKCNGLTPFAFGREL